MSTGKSNFPVKINGTIFEAKLHDNEDESKNIVDCYIVCGPCDESLSWWFEKRKKIRLKSKIVRKTSQPTWNFPFNFDLKSDVPYFKVEIRDKDKMLLGQVKFTPPVGYSIIGGWYPLVSFSETGAHEITGEVRINFVWQTSEKKAVALFYPIFRHVFAWLEKEGLGAEGIFRVSGLDSQIQELGQILVEFAEGNVLIPLETQLDQYDMHTVAGALKMYLRITQPLISEEFMEYYYSQYNIDKKENTKIITQCVNSILTGTKNILIIFMAFLGRVASKFEENKMDANNLAVVFAPVICRESTMNLDNLKKQHDLVQAMIEDFNIIFGEGSEAKALSEEGVNISAPILKKKGRAPIKIDQYWDTSKNRCSLPNMADKSDLPLLRFNPESNSHHIPLASSALTERNDQKSPVSSFEKRLKKEKPRRLSSPSPFLGPLKKKSPSKGAQKDIVLKDGIIQKEGSLQKEVALQKDSAPQKDNIGTQLNISTQSNSEQQSEEYFPKEEVDAPISSDTEEGESTDEMKKIHSRLDLNQKLTDMLIQTITNLHAKQRELDQNQSQHSRREELLQKTCIKCLQNQQEQREETKELKEQVSQLKNALTLAVERLTTVESRLEQSIQINVKLSKMLKDMKSSDN